jgi:hypothetical protein
VGIGDRLRVGTAELDVTQPRDALPADWRPFFEQRLALTG